MTESRRPELPALTGLRFIAAFWVVLHHAMRHWRPGIIPQVPILWDLLYYGYEAVGLFFVLSGFILAYSYTDGTGRLRGSIRAYYVNRVARIYPVYCFAMLVGAGPYVWLNTPSPATAWHVGVHAATLTQAWTLDNFWNSPGWSLSVEAFFYLLFPLLLVPLARAPRRLLIPVALALWACSLGIAVAYMAGMQVGMLENTYFPYVLYENPLCRLPEFCMGLVLGRYFALGGRLMLPIGIVWAGVIASVVMIAHLPTPLSLTGMLAPAWGILVLVLATRRRSVLACTALVALGEASYSLYLLHYPLWDWFTHLLGIPEAQTVVPSAFLFIVLGLYLVLLLVASLLSYRLVETPARRIIRRLAQSSHEGSRIPASSSLLPH